MSSRDELRLIARIAHLYHEAGLRQPEIASRLGLSQSTVSRMLRRAVDQGIVQITVRVPPGVHTGLESRLVDQFGLQEAIIADVAGGDGQPGAEQAILRAIGGAAAYYVETTVRSGEVVGISSWSASLLAMVDAMAPARNHAAEVVQILGGMGNPAAEHHATHLTRRLAERLGATACFLPAPGVTPSAEAREIYLDAPFVRETLARFDSVTVALVGIGDVSPSSLLSSSGNVFRAIELEQLLASDAVGDICLRFYDSQGRGIHSDLDQRVISMSLEQLAQVERVVAVAGGRRKVDAIRGALEGKLVDVMVTDYDTAICLLGMTVPD